MEVDHRLSPLKRGDLQFTYPLSTGEDDPFYREKPNSSRLSRAQWYEMLYFCNHFSNQHFNGSKAAALIVERMIKGGFVPIFLHEQTDIESFILDNWYGIHRQT